MGKIEQVRKVLRDPFMAFDQLNRDERRVLRLASRGFTNKEIGAHQQVSDDMVAYVLRNGLLKINMKKKDLANKVFLMIEGIVGKTKGE